MYMMQGFALILATTSAFLTLRTSEAESYDFNKNEDNYSKVSCDFSKGTFCGWESLGGEENNLIWTLGYNASSDNHYARLDLSNRTFPSPTIGKLVSPWLEPKGPEYNCSLQFSYYNELSGRCQFFLYQESPGDPIPDNLWSMSYGTGKQFAVHNQRVHCTTNRYRLVFKGVRHKGENWTCGDDPQNSIAVDDIIFHVHDGENELTSPVFSFTAVQTTDGTTEIATAKLITDKANRRDSHHHDEEEETALGTTTIAGVVTATVVVVIVLVILIAITIKQSRKRKDGRGPLVCFKSSSRTNDITCAGSEEATNVAFTSDEHDGKGAAPNDYETVKDGGGLMTSFSPKTDDVYNRLGVQPDAAAEQRVPQNHYDHFNTISDTYDRTHMESRRRDEERGLKADTYTHISMA